MERNSTTVRITAALIADSALSLSNQVYVCTSSRISKCYLSVGVMASCVVHISPDR